MLLVLDPQTLLSPFTSLIVLVSSCNTMFFVPSSLSRCSVGYSLTWFLLYRLVHSTYPIALSSGTSSDSVVLQMLIFWVDDPKAGEPIPRNKQYPEWLFMSVWTANDASIQQAKLPDPSDLTINGRWIMALTYRTNLPSFFQSPTLGHFTCLHRKATALCKSGLALLATFRKRATIRWE